MRSSDMALLGCEQEVAIRLHHRAPNGATQMIGKHTARIGQPDHYTCELSTETAKWDASVRSRDVSGRSEAMESLLDLHLRSGLEVNASVGIDYTFSDWTTKNYVVMPAAVYAGNRFESRPYDYPPIFRDRRDHRVDLQTTVSDIPGLSLGEGPSQIQLLTRDLATPAVGIYFPEKQKGVWLLVDPRTCLGDSGLFVEESEDRRTCRVSVTAPGVRVGLRYHHMRMTTWSQDRGADFRVGNRIALRLRVFWFECRDIPTLFDEFIGIRHDLSGEPGLPNTVPFSAAWDILEDKYNRQNWDEEHGLYRVSTAGEGPRDIWQMGWNGGVISTLCLLSDGNETSRSRALQNLGFFFDKTSAPSGFFYGVSDGEKMYDEFHDLPGTKDWLFVRKVGDAIYFVTRELLLLAQVKPGFKIPFNWRQGLRDLCEAFARLWDRHGQFGQFISHQTGEIIVGGSACGGTAVAGLALAAQYFGEPNYRGVAEQAAEMFYDRYVRQGFTTGGAGDILQCPDSESAFGLLEAYIILYETTDDPKWLAMARDTGNICASWCMTYDYRFPDRSLFGRLDMRTTGSVWASAQNKHAAPGICTSSGLSLFKLYRATGKEAYLRLIREIAHSLPQYLARKDRPIAGLEPGWMNERINTSDWLEPMGEIFSGSCWSELSLMLTYAELPGLYVQPDTGVVCAIDNVEVEVLERTSEYLKIQLTNPTDFDAQVKLFAETSTETDRPLGVDYLLQCPKIRIAAQSQSLEEVALQREDL